MKRHLASLLILILSAALFAADEHAMRDLAKVQEIAKGAMREKFPDAEDVMIERHDRRHHLHHLPEGRLLRHVG